MKRPLALALLASLIAAAPAAAQVDLRAAPKPPVRERVIIEPGLSNATRPSDLDRYPRSSGVRHDPAFIAPLSSKRVSPISTGRVGVSGWTSPNTPVGGAAVNWGEVTGWFGFGISFTWDGPPESATTR
jgi:hypothetical protein